MSNTIHHRDRRDLPRGHRKPKPRRQGTRSAVIAAAVREG